MQSATNNIQRAHCCALLTAILVRCQARSDVNERNRTPDAYTPAFQSIYLQQAQTQQYARMHTPTNRQSEQVANTLQAHQRGEQIAIRDLMRKRAQSLTRETVSFACAHTARTRTSRCSRKRNIVNEASDGNCWLRDTCSEHSNKIVGPTIDEQNTAAHAQNRNEYMHTSRVRRFVQNWSPSTVRRPLLCKHIARTDASMSATSTFSIAEYTPSAARRSIVACVNCIDCADKSYIYRITGMSGECFRADARTHTRTLDTHRSWPLSPAAFWLCRTR